jgi:hypothetical protein
MLNKKTIAIVKMVVGWLSALIVVSEHGNHVIPVARDLLG